MTDKATVETPHPEYEKMAPSWQKMADVFEGEEAIKAQEELYLPRLEGQKRGAKILKGTGLESTVDDAYEAYLMRASFHPATERTIRGMVSSIFRKDLNHEKVPEDIVNDITGDGVPLMTFAKHAATNLMKLGRFGILVDVPRNELGETGARSRSKLYDALSILNWRVERIGDEDVLTMVVLKEVEQTKIPGDEFQTAGIEQWRVLSLEEGRYMFRVFRKVSGKDDEFVEVDRGVPQRRGMPLDRIPFEFFNVTSLEADVEQPPLLGLANINLSHYRTSADLEHGAHWTAIPTFWISGALMNQPQGTGGAMPIGAGVLWQLLENGTAGVLEFSGAGLGALEGRLERKEKHMAVLGARLLEEQKAGVEAAQTVEARHRGENSILGAISDQLSRGFSKVVGLMVWWDGTGPAAPEPIEVSFNKDFFPAPMSFADLLAISSAWQNGTIGGEAVFNLLKKGEALPEDWKMDDWEKDIRENGMSAFDLGFGGPDDDEEGRQSSGSSGRQVSDDGGGSNRDGPER